MVCGGLCGYLVGVGVCKSGVVLARAVAGPVLIHGRGRGSLVQQAALCGGIAKIQKD